MSGCAVTANGEVPPGNAKGNTTWAIRRSAAKPEIKLTPGKGVQDLTCSIEALVDQVIKDNKVRKFKLMFPPVSRPQIESWHLQGMIY